MMRPRRGLLGTLRDRGFSAVEMVVVLAMMSSISAVLYSAFAVQNDTTLREGGNTISQNQVRELMDRMVREIQSAGFDPRSAEQFGFLETSDQRVRFTTDRNRDGVLQGAPSENQGFDLSGTTLRQWQGGTTWQPLASGVESLRFEYLDARGRSTDVRSAVREIRITLGLRSRGRSPRMAADLKTLRSSAYLRNW